MQRSGKIYIEKGKFHMSKEPIEMTDTINEYILTSVNYFL